MEKRRGRPPGTKKQEIKLEVSTAEPKKEAVRQFKRFLSHLQLML